MLIQLKIGSYCIKPRLIFSFFAVRFYQREGFEISGQTVDENTGEIELSMIWSK
jgi:hypothetical protein